MKKLIAMLLALVMVLGLCACGASNAPAASAPAAAAPAASNDAAAPAESAAEPAAEGSAHTIGINDFVMGAYAIDVMINACQQITDICGDTLQKANDEGNPEKIVSDLENFIASGVDAVLWWGLLPTNFEVGPQKCEDAGIPIAYFDKLPAPEQIDKIQAMSTYAGGVGNSDYMGGVNMANYALELGCKKAVIAAAEVGDTTHDPRVAGFTEVFTAGGGEVMNVIHINSGSDATAAVDNLINGFPDADCLFASGGDYALAGVAVSNTYGLQDSLKILAVDISPDLLPYLVDGSLAAGCGAHWVSGMFTAALLENYLDGHPITDANGLVAMIPSTPLIVVPADCADLYERFWINEFPFEVDEMKTLLYRFNPDVTLQDFVDMIEGYSVESRLIAKYNAGKVSADELAAVGINVG